MTRRSTAARSPAGTAEGDPAPRLHVAAEGADPLRRFDAWRDAFFDVNDILPHEAPLADFRAEMTLWPVGVAVLSDFRMSAHRTLRTRAHLARDGLDHWAIIAVGRGAVDSAARGASFTAGPGALVLGSFAAPYDDRWTESAGIGLYIPRDAAPWLGALPEGVQHGAGAALLAEHLHALAHRLRSATAQEAQAAAAPLMAMLEVGLRDGDAGERRAALLARRRVDRVIRSEIASARLDVRRISQLSGVSRSSLYRMFEPEGGVASHVQTLRLNLVAADLSKAELAATPISRIAEARGFHCVASFNRAFRRAFGRTPTAERASALSGDHAARPASALLRSAAAPG